MVFQGTAFTAEMPMQSLKAQTVQVLTKGFPCILKLTIEGPGYAPLATLTDEHVSIRVEFESLANHKVYRVVSTKGMEISVVTAEGYRRDDIAEKMWQTPVSEETTRSVLLDIASLRPELGKGSILADVPPGEYNVRVELPGVKTRSNVLSMKLVSPTEPEQQFLNELQAQEKVKHGNQGIWSSLIEGNVRYPKNAEWDRLSTTTREQTSFHMLLARLTASDNVLGPDDEIAIKTTALPKFLEPERECLLYEVRTAMGKSDEAEAFRLMKRYPDLEWRLREIKVGGKDFLRYRKVVTGKSK